MSAGTVLIATNLAGRGTDIKIAKDVVKNGGLHVCITFLPSNLRVEHQATGRASRGGQPGTSQIVINGEKDAMFVDIKDFLSPVEIKYHRDNEEAKRIEKIRLKVIPSLEIDESNFQKYSNLRCTLRNSAVKNDNQTLAAMDERWGLALDISKNTDIQITANHFNNFFSTMKSQVMTGDVIQNPYYYILKGIDNNSNGQYGNAMKNFDAAVNMDTLFSANAYYYKAYAIINDFGGEYQKRAGECLNEAVKLIQNVNIPTLLACHNMGTSGKEEPRDIIDYNSKEVSVSQVQQTDSDFTRQIVNKISLLQVQLKSVEEAMKVMENEKEVKAEMVGIDNYFQENNIPAPRAEIDEFRESGLCGFIKVVKKPPPWWTVFVVILVGVVQAVAGAVLAVCTGGAFGTGLILDGIGDVVTGIKAAVSGEYISLGDFFKGKAISIAISAIAAGAGAALSAAAKTVTTFFKTVSTKFLSTGIGKFASTAFTSAKSGLTKMFTSVKGTLVDGWQTFQSFVVEISPKWLKNAASNAKAIVVAAWGTIKDSWKKACDWTNKKLDTLMTKLTPNAMTEMQKQKLNLATKLIVGEVAKTGILEGLNYAVDNLIMDPLMNAIKKKLEKDIQDQVKSLLENEENALVIRKYFERADNPLKFDELWKKFQKVIKKAVSNQFNNSAPSEIVEYLFKGIEEFSGEAQRIMKDSNKTKGHRNIIAEVISKSVTVALDSAKFGMLVNGLQKFIASTFATLREELTKDIETTPNSPEISYISTKKGMHTFEFMKKNSVKDLSEDISEKLSELIKSGIIKPQIDMSLSKLTGKLNPIRNQDDLLDDIEKLYEETHPERNTKATFYEIFRGKPKDNANVNVNPDGQENANNRGENGTSGTDDSDMPWYKQLEFIERLSAIANRCVEIFKVDKTTGEIEMGVVGSFRYVESDEPPIRLFSTYNSSNDVRYDPIIRNDEGSLKVLPLETLQASMSTISRSNSLLTSVEVIQAYESSGDIAVNNIDNLGDRLMAQSLTFGGKDRIHDILTLESL